MADDAENMGLMPSIIDGIAHGLAVDGKTSIFLGVGFVPTLQGSVQMHGIDPDQDIADDRFTWDAVTVLGKTAAEAEPGILAEAFGPIGYGSVSAHAAQARPGDKGQNRAKSMPSPLGSARVGDLGKKGR